MLTLRLLETAVGPVGVERGKRGGAGAKIFNWVKKKVIPDRKGWHQVWYSSLGSVPGRGHIGREKKNKDDA